MTTPEPHARAFDLRQEHVSLDDDGASQPIEITPDFWPDVLAGHRQLGRWMMGANHRTDDTPSWDLHPRGECIATLLTGAIDIVVAADDNHDETVCRLREPGASVVIPCRSCIHPAICSF